MRTFLVGILLASASAASAQTFGARGYVSVNAALQAISNDFSDRFEFEKDFETGSTESDYQVKSGFAFDAAGGVRFWKNLGAGIAVTSVARDGVAQTATRSPHPFHFEQFRDGTGEATGLARQETAVHAQLLYYLKVSDPVLVVLSGGPSFFNVKQDLVTDVVLNETFPHDTATFSSVRKQTVKETRPAFNVGLDVMWMLRRRIGIGGLLRVSRASVDLTAPGSRTVTVDAGGVYAGGGMRVIF